MWASKLFLSAGTQLEDDVTAASSASVLPAPGDGALVPAAGPRERSEPARHSLGDPASLQGQMSV